MFKIAPNLSLPADAVTQTFAILAKRGVGKTYTASVLTEELLAHGSHVVVIDPTGAWWGLRSSADGKRPGFPIVVFGGDHADVPLEASAGEVIAHNLVEHRFPAIIDLSLLRKGESLRFMAAFLETLYRKNREALHLVVDEADTFAPQRVMGEDARVCGAMEDVVKKGRIRGLGCTLITQRPQVINKNVLTQCESIIAMRMSHPKDIGAIKEWIGVHASDDDAGQVIASLPALPIGTAWFWSPGWLQRLVQIKVRERQTFDSSATPKAGEKRKVPKSLAEIDLAKLSADIQQTVERAKADDPKRLKARIAELERELAALKAKPAKAEPVITEKDIQRIEAAARRVDDALTKAFGEITRGTVQQAYKQLVRITTHVKFPPEPPPGSLPQPPQVSPKAPAISQNAGGLSPNRAKVLPSKPAADGEPRLGKAEVAIAGALYWLRDEEATPAKVAFYAGYSVKSSSFANALGRLRSQGLAQGLRLTAEGEQLVAGSVGPKPSGTELRRWLHAKLGKAENTILDALIAAGGQRLSNEAIAEATSYSVNSSSFANALGTLRTIEAAEGYPRDGGTKAHDVFFS